jgi:hypothetical protein
MNKLAKKATCECNNHVWIVYNDIIKCTFCGRFYKICNTIKIIRWNATLNKPIKEIKETTNDTT